MPAKLAVNGQQHRKLSVRVFRAGGAQRLLDARNVRRGEPGFLDFIGQVQIFGHAHVLRRPRREGKMTGGLVIVKLYAADALVKEPPLLLQAGQRLRYMLLPGQCVLPQEGIGNMLCVCQTVQLAAGARSNAQLGMQLRAAVERGCRLIVVDPRVTWLAARAEYHSVRHSSSSGLNCPHSPFRIIFTAVSWSNAFL